MYQKIVLVGNLGQDPEMRYTPAGDAYTRFSLAVNRKWTDRDGTSREEVTWFKIVTWGKLAEVCNQYLAKGRPVLIEGDRIRASAYLNRENQPTASIEITASTVRFLGSRRDHEQAEATEKREAVADTEEADSTTLELPF